MCAGAHPPDVLALSFVPGLPRAELFSLLRETDEPLESVLAALGVAQPERTAEAARREAEEALANARKKGIEALPWLDPRYPPLLAVTSDPPLVLWVRGSADLLSAISIAIVGSRAASVYGEDTALRLASDLARSGFAIVSGLARGIDGAAHRGALGVGGRTTAVLGCGADVVYPPEHAALMDEVVRLGVVVSEFPPGTPPRAGQFPRRNRIISGLSRAVVVVEAWQRSGALITADCALAQGREVMAVPGSVLGERHRGCHALLKAGAALVESAADVLDALKLSGIAPESLAPAPTDDPLLRAMDPGEPYAIDALATLSGTDTASLLTRLLELELQGLVRRLPGGRFVRPCGNVLT